MSSLKRATLILILTLSALTASCSQPTGGECDACTEHLWLRVFFEYDVAGSELTYVFNEEPTTKAAPTTDNPDYRFSLFRFDSPLPETLDIQVYQGDTLKLDTTITPDYHPTFDECTQETNPECMTANEDVYVTDE